MNKPAASKTRVSAVLVARMTSHYGSLESAREAYRVAAREARAWNDANRLTGSKILWVADSGRILVRHASEIQYAGSPDAHSVLPLDNPRPRILPGASMKDFDFDECPVHASPCVKEYDYGMMDSCVYKYACGCAASTIGDSLNDHGVYHANFADADGRARLGKAIWAAK